MQGQVYKAHSNTYFVKSDNKLHKCGARGVLKIKGDGISVGDYVKVERGVISEVLPRNNHFIRPNVSNIDVIVAVISAEPKPDFLLVDKLMISAQKEDVEFIIAVNKTDIDDTLVNKVREEYAGLPVKILEVSATTKSGLDQLKELLKGKLSVLAGQSAVGKTSIVNAIFNLNQKVGDLSEKIARGKHTTTRSEIFEFDEYKIVDSPGFAVIEADVDIDQISECYPDYFEHLSECKFRGCHHVSEPDCMVKKLVEQGKLSKSRYQRYLQIYNEIAKRREVYEKN
ncbi:MAG: ribosome small subunit-dependent GTPase A [Clostridia bacterium]|nr:ribosome small subunit-dependent GTPase A [Clostridia bacterium]